MKFLVDRCAGPALAGIDARSKNAQSSPFAAGESGSPILSRDEAGGWSEDAIHCRAGGG